MISNISFSTTAGSVSLPLTVLQDAVNSIRLRFVGQQVTSTTATEITGALMQQLTYPSIDPESYRRIRAEQAAMAKAAAVEKAAADERAEKLLVDHLTPQQYEQLRACGYFEVNVKGRTYRIFRGWSMNVQLVDGGGKKLRSYCAVPKLHVPIADQMLAQKLMLEFEEHEFLRVANVRLA